MKSGFYTEKRHPRFYGLAPVAKRLDPLAGLLL
jgi:hypothetical protein